MSSPHPDDPSQEWPTRIDSDIGEAFNKLKDYMRQEEQLMKEVKEIVNPPKPVNFIIVNRS